MILIIDNYDSFVYNLVRYFKELGKPVMIIKNDQMTLEEIKKIKPEGIVFSPGPKRPENTGLCLKILEQLKAEQPILGICLGHQAIGYGFGAEIVKCNSPAHGKLALVCHDGKGIFEGIKQDFKVTRYHSLMISEKDFPPQLQISARTYDGVIMGVRHKLYPIEGVQFHPEAELTQYGHEILNNFIRICDLFDGSLK